MSQDIVADALNQIMNAKRVEKKEIHIKRSSKFLVSLLESMKKKGYIDYSVAEGEKGVNVKIIKLNECKAIKPRRFTGFDDIEKYLRRYLPSRKFGHLLISTNKGLIDQHEAIENKIGGALIAYIY
ncbi:MAG: 30S ribosomal protein S8 [Candidatus Pacearchaeota archaeon]